MAFESTIRGRFGISLELIRFNEKKVLFFPKTLLKHFNLKNLRWTFAPAYTKDWIFC